MAGDTALGSGAHWRFDAPGGTAIMRLQLWRNIGKAVNTWELFTRLADGTKLASSDCSRPIDQFTCQLGGPGTPPADWADLSTSSVRVGIACVNTSTTCAPGGTLHHAWTAIYRSIVTIDDPTPPTASGAGGSLLAGGYLRGNATATVDSAADGTGIRAVQVRVDGDRIVAETPLSCDYTRAAPCDDVAAPATVPVVTSTIGDGTWTARVGVVDAGGNFTAAGTQAITVDNGAPVPPAATSPAFVTTGETATTISWREPGNQVSPITTAYVTLCKDVACRTTTQPAGTGTGSATLQLADGPGAYTASVALGDAAGNHVPSYATHWAITRVADAATPQTGRNGAPVSTRPSARLTLATPMVARDRRTIGIRGTVAPTANGRVTVTIRARVAGRMRTVSRRATIRDRRYRVSLRLPSARWRTAAITVRYPGSTAVRSALATRTLHRR